MRPAYGIPGLGRDTAGGLNPLAEGIHAPVDEYLSARDRLLPFAMSIYARQKAEEEAERNRRADIYHHKDPTDPFELERLKQKGRLADIAAREKGRRGYLGLQLGGKEPSTALASTLARLAEQSGDEEQEARALGDLSGAEEKGRDAQFWEAALQNELKTIGRTPVDVAPRPERPVGREMSYEPELRYSKKWYRRPGSYARKVSLKDANAVINVRGQVRAMLKSGASNEDIQTTLQEMGIECINLPAQSEAQELMGAVNKGKQATGVYGIPALDGAELYE